MTSKWAKGASGGQALWFFFLRHLRTFLSLPLFFLFACSSEDSSLCEAQAMIQKEQHRCMMIFYSELLSKREDVLDVQIIDEMNIWRYYKRIKLKVVYDIVPRWY